MHLYKEPPTLHNFENRVRRVGFEIEFCNVDIEVVAKAIKEIYGADVAKLSDFYYEVKTDIGTFVVELDLELLTKNGLKSGLEDISKKVGFKISSENILFVERLVAKIGKNIVPYEVVTPPISFENIDRVDAIVDVLFNLGAHGTDVRAIYAFGLHINPEVVSLEIDSILDYLRAYVLLQDYLKEEVDVDTTRTLSPFIDDFKRDYIAYILHESYNPTKDEFIDDYIEYNPTRNRSLDMLPLLAYLDESKVRKLLVDQKIHPRPTFHYRLANSHVSDPSWSVAIEWNRWVVVEKLAHNKSMLKELSQEYLDHLNATFNLSSYRVKLDRWLGAL